MSEDQEKDQSEEHTRILGNTELRKISGAGGGNPSSTTGSSDNSGEAPSSGG